MIMKAETAQDGEEVCVRLYEGVFICCWGDYFLMVHG
jgi:hypothetical protein